MSTEVISELFDPFQLGKPRDKSIEQYEPKPFYPVGGKDLTRYKNNTLRIVTKGLDQHLHLSEGYIELVWQMVSTPLAPYVITAGVNDTFLVADSANALTPATIPPLAYANIGALNTAFQNAITAAGQTGANFTLTNPAGLVVLTLSTNVGNKINLGTGLRNYLGFSASQFTFTSTAVPQSRTAVLNTQHAVMHDNALSLFRKASLYFNNVEIHSIDYPVFSSTIRNIQDYSQDFIDKHKEMWFYIEPESHDLATPLASEKTARTGANLWVRTHIPLKRIFPILDTYDKVLRGVEVRVELERNEYNISEIAYAIRATPSITLKELTMWVPEVIGSPVTEAMLLEDVVGNKEKVITYDHHEIYRQLNPPQQQLNWVIDTIAEVPKQIYIGLQLRSQLDETQFDVGANGIDINPSIYQNLLMVRAEAHINGHVFPKMPYQINFGVPTATTADEYNRLYWDFLRVNFKESEVDNGSLLEYTKQYKDVYPLVAFDMSRDHSVQKNSTKNNNVEIFLQFAQAPPQDFYISACVVYENNLVLRTDGKSYEWIKI